LFRWSAAEAVPNVCSWLLARTGQMLRSPYPDIELGPSEMVECAWHWPVNILRLSGNLWKPPRLMARPFRFVEENYTLRFRGHLQSMPGSLASPLNRMNVTGYCRGSPHHGHQCRAPWNNGIEATPIESWPPAVRLQPFVSCRVPKRVHLGPGLGRPSRHGHRGLKNLAQPRLLK
jgi:hypothetical protein